MKTRILLIEWLAVSAFLLIFCGVAVYRVDPYFHYHKPLTDEYYYSLDNQRSQNDGISKYFDYDALITGTSMTENFKTSEFDEIFGVNSVKVCYSGGSYKEINDNLIVALENNKDLKTIVRCLDIGRFFDDKDLMREDLGEYPSYLYDRDPLNDVHYLLNRDVIFSRVYKMIRDSEDENSLRGMTSFDDYGRWQDLFEFGIDQVVPERNLSSSRGEPIHLTDAERKVIEGNITQNVTSLADQYPDVDFYYFFSPYSIAWWSFQLNEGTLDRQIEAEKYIIELILDHSNIHLYSFSDRVEIITDLNNYKDTYHYGEWVNSLILEWMYEGEGHLTKDNYEQYIDEEYDFYANFDYEIINAQKDRTTSPDVDLLQELRSVEIAPKRS